MLVHVVGSSMAGNIDCYVAGRMIYSSRGLQFAAHNLARQFPIVTFALPFDVFCH